MMLSKSNTHSPGPQLSVLTSYPGRDLDVEQKGWLGPPRAVIQGHQHPTPPFAGSFTWHAPSLFGFEV